MLKTDLAEIVALIQSLNPRPGASIAAPDPEYIVPDVIVRKHNDRWVVELNGEATPRIRINDTYASLIKRADNSADNTFLRNNLQEARWFMKSLQSRHETLLKVATKIVEHQRGFLEYGEEAMKPLVLHDIAEAVEMHESTISRVTSHKYMHTPRGIFELKYFFSSHVSTPDRGRGIQYRHPSVNQEYYRRRESEETVERQQDRGNTRQTEHPGGTQNGRQVSGVHGHPPVQRTQTSCLIQPSEPTSAFRTSSRACHAGSGAE